MPYRILLRRDNSAKWIQNDPVLMLGEPGYETDTGKLKIGDGQTPWSSLAYYNGLDLTVVNKLDISSNSEPSNKDLPVEWAKIKVSDSVYWIPLYQ